jgi:hypothetical protein
MNTAIVQQGQCLMDIAIERCGSATALFELALLNEVSITEELAIGVELLLPPVVDIQAVAYFKSNGIIIATNSKKKQESLAILNPQGIGHWRIGVDFKVS